MENTIRVNALGAKVNQSEILNAARRIVRGRFVGITYMTIPSNMRKTNNPFVGDCIKVVRQVVKEGTNYGDTVEKRSGETFVPQKMSGKHHIDHFVAQADKDADQYYICFQYVECESVESRFFHIDGTPYTDAETALVKTFIPEHKESNTQAKVGLHGKDQVKVFQVKAENILRIVSDGCKVYEYEVEQFAQAFA